MKNTFARFALIGALALGVSAAHAEIKLNPGPIKGVTMVKENSRGTVWCEVVPFVGTAPNVVAHIYNSTATDNCTEERSAALDMTKLAADLGVSKAIMNPGRYWVFDRATAFTAGEIVNFNGIKAQWGATMTPQDLESSLRGCSPSIITRISKERVMLDMRTLFPEEAGIIVRSLDALLRQRSA